MRISSNEDDAGYMEFVYRGGYSAKWEIIIDGESVSDDCVTADSDMGLVIVAKRDVDGNFVLIGDFIAYEVRYGKVEIKRNGMAR